MLLKKFRAWIIANSIGSDKKILVGVSGGKDSMSLLDLLRIEKFDPAVAHVNYQLRAEDSTLDQEVVQAYCTLHKLPLHKKNCVFDPVTDGNLQVWARNQRRAYFEEICLTFGYDYVALAHHQSDQTETILLSISKGYDLQLMEDFVGSNPTYIRPLLHCENSLIEDYASANQVPYRDDKSNADSKYDRNFLRNELIPLMGERFENFSNRFNGFAERQHKKKHLTRQAN